MALQRGTLIRNLYHDMKSTGTLTSSQMKTTKTAQGKLTVFEQTKAVAFQKAIAAMEKHLGKSCWELTGQGKADFTAGHLRVQGGGQPSGRAIKAIWAKVQQDGEWFPGQTPVKQVGRPPQITQDQKQAIAHKAMWLKEELEAPTPQKVRIKMPKKTINKVTKKPISDSSMQRVFKALCYDEREDDPWQYRNAPQQDCLTQEDYPARVRTAEHILRNVTKAAAWNFVAIDPCFCLLPRKEYKAEQLKIAAMGNKKWMSKKSARKGSNLRAPSTAKTQKSHCTVVPWTPVFARGRLKLVVLGDPGAKLTDMENAAAFVRDTLPGVLASMKKEWKWSNIPRVILHDKASYFVNNSGHRLNDTFAAGLRAGGFTSWLSSGDGSSSSWLARHLGDFYLHETVVSHVRRLLNTRCMRKAIKESPSEFKARMLKVEKHMNYEMGKNGRGRALVELGDSLHQRAEALKQRQGERLPK